MPAAFGEMRRRRPVVREARRDYDERYWSPDMRPPIFVWKSGTLDVCDSPEDLDDRYPASELAQADVVVCDSRGQAVWISRAERGAWANAVELSQPPSPDLLRSILWRYLESFGTPAEEIESLSLDELVQRACPEEPVGDYHQKARLQARIAGIAICLVASIIFLLLGRIFGVH